MLHPIILAPGPVNLSLRVQEALSRPVLSPLQLEYRRLRQALVQRLLEVYSFDGANWQVIPWAASTLQAAEGVLRSLPLADTSGRDLGIIIQGPLGRRWSDLAQHLGLSPQCLDLTQACIADFSAKSIVRWIEAHPEVRFVVLVQLEAHNGLLNDFSELAATLQNLQVRCVLDASYSFGAEEIDPQRWPLCAVLASSSGPLHAPPGLSLVFLQQDLFHDLARTCTQRVDVEKKQTVRDNLPLGMDLHYWCNPPSELDIPSPWLQACLSACDEHQGQGGWASRRRRYQRQQEGIARVLKRYAVLPPSDHGESTRSSSAIRAYRLPPALSRQKFSLQLLSQGFVVDPQAHPQQDCIVFSVMGDIDELIMSRLHHALEDILHPITISISV